MVIDAHQRVLIAQRPAGKHLAGAWEFPGGKLEPAEARTQGLARELREEIGIAIRDPRPLLRVRHEYAYGRVLLDVWIVRRFSGRARGLDGQALRWVRRTELASADLLPADRPIVAALRLPERLRLAETAHYRVGDPTLLDRRSRPEGRLLGTVCGTAAEAVAANAAGADFLVMQRALGNEELEALCGRLAAPVYARGLTLERAWSLGASGINALEMPPRAGRSG